MRHIEPGISRSGLSVNTIPRPTCVAANIVAAEHLTKQHSGIR